MAKNFMKQKSIILKLLLILMISNFSISFAYWASNISGDQIISDATVVIGGWDFTDEVSIFRSDYSLVLSLTTETVQVSDKTAVEQALAAYGLLSQSAQTELTTEKDLLVDLLAEIIAFENSVFLDFETYIQDTQFTGLVDISGREWYGFQIYSANDPSYDVWNDTRALALKTGAYFQSSDLFINGVDKITLAHGARNFNNGTSFQFRIEYELDSNPGVWVVLQSGGSDLLIDVISATPLTNTEIAVNITEPVNIRFTPVIGNNTDYINLDDIRVYEHIVSEAFEAETFRTVYSNTLSLSIATVQISDKTAVQQALAAYDLLSVEAKAELTIEKSLLDSLLVEINSLDVIAEASFSQIDLDSAQALVTALPNGVEKTNLQNRIDDVQDVIDDVSLFESTHASTLLLTVISVQISDKTAVQQALADYNLLSVDAKALLSTEKALLDNLLAEINSQIPTAIQVQEFRTNHATVLALNIETIQVSNLIGVQEALDAYELLTPAAQADLSSEKILLDSLLVQIATDLVIIAEGSNLQIDLDNALVVVDTLPNGTEKIILQNRLDQVQDIIEASYVENLITALPNTGAINLSDEVQTQTARDAYEALSTAQKALVTNLSILSSAESVLADLQAATAAVVVAEGSNLQTDVNSAQALVTALPNGQAKSSLQTRLDAVQDIIDVEEATLIIQSYYASNTVILSSFWDLFSNPAKETAFLAKTNEIVDGLDVVISITNTNRTGFRNTIYTISIVKNGVSTSLVVSVDFDT